MSAAGSPAPSDPGALPQGRGPGDRRASARYGVAVLVAVLAAGGQLWLTGWLGTAAPFLFSFLAVGVAALYGGVGPGLVAVFTATLLVGYYVLPPGGTVPTSPGHLALGGLFIAVGSGIVAVTEALHRARRRAEAGQAALLASYRRLAAAQRQAAESEQRFRIAADHAPVMIWTAGTDKLCDWFNRSWIEFRGRTMAQELGNGWTEGVHPDDLERCWETYSAAFDACQPFVMDYRLQRHDGEYRWILDHGVPRIVDGALLGYIGSCLDIHDRREAEDERTRLLAEAEEARAAAERANHAKDDFLATVSHELRTPLNAVLSWAQLLQNGHARDRLASGLETIVRNARLQAQLIDDLLDLSRIVSGKMRLRVAPVDLAGVVLAAAETARPGAEGKGLELVVDTGENVAPVLGDADRLQQVIWNLLSNAVKFTPAGGRVEVRLAASAHGSTVVVRDTGIGIGAEFLPAIFERFRQIEGGARPRHGGLGLGLAIVRNLVELHGGSVEAASEGEGRGATFSVHLPLAPSRAGAETPADVVAHLPPQALAGLRVLVVDDAEDARATVRILLEAHGAAVDLAATADEAFAMVRVQRPDVLIADIGLPGESGYDLVRRIRALPPEDGGRIPAVALTAFARPEDRRRALGAGFQLHFAKPADMDVLLASVAGLAGRAGAPS